MDAPYLCPKCRYDLHNLAVPRCPECGREFSAEEWANKNSLTPPPAWERRPYVGATYAFFATIAGALFRPRRFLRGLRAGDGMSGVIALFLLLIPTMWLTAFVISVAAAGVGYFFQEHFDNYAYWLGHLWAFDGKIKFVWLNAMRVMVHVTAFLATILACWLPALVMLDLVFWRRRQSFRLFAKSLLYSMSWAGVVAAVAATLGRAVVEQFNTEWAWGPSFRNIDSVGVLPWICWTALAVIAIQCVSLFNCTCSPHCAFRLEPSWTRRAIRIIICATWLLSIYLLLFDRHIHLRFHLLFCSDELWSIYHLLLGRM